MMDFNVNLNEESDHRTFKSELQLKLAEKI